MLPTENSATSSRGLKKTHTCIDGDGSFLDIYIEMYKITFDSDSEDPQIESAILLKYYPYKEKDAPSLWFWLGSIPKDRWISIIEHHYIWRF